MALVMASDSQIFKTLVVKLKLAPFVAYFVTGSSDKDDLHNPSTYTCFLIELQV